MTVLTDWYILHISLSARNLQPEKITYTSPSLSYSYASHYALIPWPKHWQIKVKWHELADFRLVCVSLWCGWVRAHVLARLPCAHAFSFVKAWLCLCVVLLDSFPRIGSYETSRAAVLTSWRLTNVITPSSCLQHLAD